MSSDSSPAPLSCAVISSDEGFRPLGSASFARLDDGRLTRATPSTWRELTQGGPVDLFVVDARGDVEPFAELLTGLKRRYPSSAAICLNVEAHADAVSLLAAGADVTLPADTTPELVGAHLDAALRRAVVASGQLRIRFGDVVYERESRRVWCAGREVQLTPCELRLFDILFQRAGALVSVNTLYDYVWHDEPAITGASNALAVYVRYLRRKLMGSQATIVETLRGKGYRLSRR